MNRTTQPWAVVMQLRDGSTVEQVFATRYQAETFLYLLPLLMTTQPDGDDVASAILSPLVEQHPLTNGSLLALREEWHADGR